MNTYKDLYQHAYQLYESGLSIIPLNYGQKSPAVKWAQFQTRKASLHEINTWWSAKTSATPHGIGIVTGIISNLAVLDFDPVVGCTISELVNEAQNTLQYTFPDTCRVLTCSGGYHDYYSIDAPINTTDVFTGRCGKVQLRGEKAYVAAPPTTIHTTRLGFEGHYSYIRPLEARIALNTTLIPKLLTHKTAPSIPNTATIQPSTDAYDRYKHRMSDTALQILADAVPTNDRSGLCYWLACELVRSGITNAHDVASIILTAPAHKEKYQDRPQNSAWNEWDHAQKLAHKAVDDVLGHTIPHVVLTQATQQQTQPAQMKSHTVVEDTSADLDTAFPRHVAKGLCADIASLYSENMESPYEFWYASALTCFGAAISGCVTLNTEITPQPRLYTVVVGPSGTARKSAATDMIATFFRSAFEGHDILNFEYGIGSAEGLAELLKRNDGNASRGLLIFDELRTLVRKARIEGSVLMDMLCSMYDRNIYSNATKRTCVKLRDTHISILGATTDDIYTTMWTSDFVDQGFTNRILLVPGKITASIALPPPIAQDAKVALQNKMCTLVQTIHDKSKTNIKVGTSVHAMSGNEPLRLNLTPEALKLWLEWYESWTARRGDRNLTRLDTLGYRLMLLFEVNKGNFETIEKNTVTDVIETLEWQARVRKGFAPVATDTKSAEVENRIKKVLLTKGRMNIRDLRQNTNADRFGLELFNKALVSLTHANIISVTTTSRGIIYQIVE